MKNIYKACKRYLVHYLMQELTDIKANLADCFTREM
jgi:hypothetical protein